MQQTQVVGKDALAQQGQEDCKLLVMQVSDTVPVTHQTSVHPLPGGPTKPNPGGPSSPLSPRGPGGPSTPCGPGYPRTPMGPGSPLMVIPGTPRICRNNNQKHCSRVRSICADRQTHSQSYVRLNSKLILTYARTS